MGKWESKLYCFNSGWWMKYREMKKSMVYKELIALFIYLGVLFGMAILASMDMIIERLSN